VPPPLPDVVLGGSRLRVPWEGHGALISHSLTVLWYVQHGQRTRAAQLRTLPWYTHKADTTFSDMLATCVGPRGASDFLIQRHRRATCENVCGPLVDDVASGA
jgi:hypothetical protein